MEELDVKIKIEADFSPVQIDSNQKKTLQKNSERSKAIKRPYYSEKQKEKAVRLLDRGVNFGDVALLMGCSRGTPVKWRMKAREAQSIRAQFSDMIANAWKKPPTQHYENVGAINMKNYNEIQRIHATRLLEAGVGVSLVIESLESASKFQDGKNGTISKNLK